MKTYLFFILIFAASSFSFATTPIENLPTKMQYIQENVRHTLKDSALYKIQSWASQNNLSQYTTNGILPYEILLTDSSLEKSILITSNRRTNAEYTNHIYNHKSGYLLQIKTKDQQFALFLLRHSESEAQKIFEYFRDDSVVTKKTSSRFPASETASGGSGSSSPRTSRQSSSTATTSGPASQSVAEYAYAFASSSKACVMGAVEGVTGLAEPFRQAGRSLVSLTQDPGAWWDRSISDTADFMENMADFKAFANRQIEGFTSKTPEEKSSLYCGFLSGGVAVGAALKVSKIGLTERLAASSQKGLASLGVEATTALSSMKEIISGLSSRSAATVNAAIQKAAQLNITPEIATQLQRALGIYPVNKQLAKIVDGLVNVIENGGTNLALQTDAMNALIKFGKSATGGWTKGYISRVTGETIPDLAWNYKLPDSVRMLAYEATKEINIANNFASPGVYVTSAELSAKNTIGFLGKTYKDLPATKSYNAHFIENNFKTLSNEAKNSIYASLNSGKGIPQEFIAQYVETASITNANYVRGVLERTGFIYDTSRTQVGRVIVYTNPKTGSTVRLADDVPAGKYLRTYTAEETAQLKAAITGEKKSYSIDRNRQ